MPAEHELAQSRIDRLVDGELNAEEYLLLLEELEDEPDGWRRCAMAFLEAQAWTTELHGIGQSMAIPVVDKAPANCSGTAWLGWKPMAIVASVLVAFGLGVGSAYVAPQIASPEFVVDDERHAVPDGTAVVDRSSSPNVERGHGGVATLAVDDANAFDFSPIFRDHVREYDEFLREMQRDGHVVRRYQREVPVELEDGRRGTVPVEQFEIVPVHGEFQ